MGSWLTPTSDGECWFTRVSLQHQDKAVAHWNHLDSTPSLHNARPLRESIRFQRCLPKKETQTLFFEIIYA
jgi:hypothetical protein